ncbi:hypothetical protein [Nonomuraea cavernae]|uniref:hypothetical protein n=1 Tax=Nonomuraea cavernae TaxID=2045107 RepID=UPI0034024EDA
MTYYWFPDNTVLCNFAAVSELPLLEKILRGRGRWVEAIAYEAERSSRVYPELSSIARDQWLGEPIEVDDPKAIREIDAIRRAAFGGTLREPLKHLGEAQTCYVMLNWPQFARSYWITDDRDAAEYARARGITTRDTAEIVSEGVQDGCCARDEGFKLLHQMREAGRHVRLPVHPSHL